MADVMFSPQLDTIEQVQGDALFSALKTNSSGVKEFDQSDYETDTPWVDSLGASFRSWGTITGAYQAAKQHERRSPDPEFDLKSSLEARPDYMETLDPYLKDAKNPVGQALFANLVDAQNEGDLDQIMANFKKSQEDLATAQANGWLPNTLGAVGGLGLDVLALSFISGGTPALARTAASARAMAAGRVGALGALEAGVERAAHATVDPTISTTDIWEAAGFGGGFGAALGLAFPTFVGNVRKYREALEPHPMTDELVAGARAESAVAQSTTGAAEVLDEAGRTVSPAAGTATVIAKDLGHGKGGVFRGPKRVLEDRGARGDEQYKKYGWQGNRKFFNVMTRVLHLTTVMEDEVGGSASRVYSVQQLRDNLDKLRVAREHEASGEYHDMVSDLYGLKGKIGAAATTLRNTTLLPARARPNILSIHDYEDMSNRLGIAIGEGREWDNVIPPAVADTLTPEQQVKLMNHLERSALAENDFYQRWGKMEVDAKLLDPEDLIPGYRPQIWNRQAIANDPDGFDHMLLMAWSKDPDPEFIRKGWVTKADDGTEKPIIAEGETYNDLYKRDPALALEVLDEWGAAVKQVAEEKAAKLEYAFKEELDRLTVKSAAEAHAKVEERTARAEAFARRLEARLERAKAAGDQAEIDAATRRLGSLERQINDEWEKLRFLRRNMANRQALDEYLMEYGNNAQKRLLRDTKKGLDAATKKAVRAEARLTIKQQLEDIRHNIVEGKNAFGFVEPEFITTSSRFKRRAIRLGSVRDTEAARKFLHGNYQETRAAYVANVGTQIAMRRAFGPLLDREGLEFTDANIKKMALAGYNLDLSRVKDATSRAEIQKERKSASEFFDNIMKELTFGDRGINTPHQQNFSDFTRALQSATAAMALGSVSLAQLGDLAVMMMAGGKMGTGFNVMWRGLGRKLLKEIAADDAETWVLLQGASAIDGSRLLKMVDLDTAAIDIPGGMFKTISRKVDEVATLEGWLNFMHIWNNVVRGGFGLDFARQISKDMGRYGKLSDRMKTFYARVHISEKEAAEMADMLKRAHKSYAKGKLRLPDREVWARERPDLMERWEMAMKAAGDEALLDPSIGDRPFLRSHTAGRLVLQFQSFMFTAGERFIAPMTQELMLHKSVRPVFIALAGLFMGSVTDALKYGVRGEFNQWYSNWDNPEGIKNNLWGAFIRSPMLPGPSSTLLDVGLSNFGRVANDLTSMGTGVRPFRQEASRLRENQGFGALAGPGVGMLTGTLPSLGKKWVDPNVSFSEAAMATSHRLPLLNVLGLQTAIRLWESY